MSGEISAARWPSWPQSGSIEASAGRYSASAGTSGTPVVRSTPVRASTMGLSGTGDEACTARPAATVKFLADATEASSLASRDFPTPASPVRTIRPPS